MSFIIKLLLVAAVHVLFYAGYPDTGHYGNYILIISFLVWSGFMLFISIPISIFKLFFSGTLGMVLNLAIFILMCVSVAYTMPQQDGSRVLDKLRKGAYPSATTFRSGLKRLVVLHNEVKTETIELGKKAKKAAEKYEDYRDNGRNGIRGRHACKKSAQ